MRKWCFVLLVALLWPLQGCGSSQSGGNRDGDDDDSRGESGGDGDSSTRDGGAGDDACGGKCDDNAVWDGSSGNCVCDAGFEGDGESCDDIDECADDDANDCDENADCVNRDGGFSCECKDGFAGDGRTCEEAGEACSEDDAAECSANAGCVVEDGSPTCKCLAPFAGDDAEACYCDLSGFWAVRQDLDTCWEGLDITGTDFIEPGAMEASVWELHKYTYDGQTIVVEKKGCGADNTPDFVSPLFGPGETYSSYVPDDLFDTLDLQPAKDIVEAGVLPGAMFDTPSEAAVVGIDLGDDPESADWPLNRTDTVSYVNDEGGDVPAWVDTDGDGEPGLTLWPKLPSEAPDDGSAAAGYSYLPARPGDDGSGNLIITERAACVSVATRIITHLEVEVDTCTELSGNVINESTEGRVHSCLIQPSDEWDQDATCSSDDWDTGERCTDEDLVRLDDDQNQEQTSNATFRMVKIGSLDDDVDCADVRAELPAVERPVPTVTCR